MSEAMTEQNLIDVAERGPPISKARVPKNC